MAGAAALLALGAAFAFRAHRVASGLALLAALAGGLLYALAAARRRAREERALLEARLLESQRLEALGRMAAGVAHDFNNILTAVLGHAQLAETEAPEGAPCREELAEIREASRRGAALTERLLAFSKGRRKEPVPTDLGAVAQGMEKLLERLLEGKVRLAIRVAPDLRPVIADPAGVEQALLNLVLNARDAMPEGGEILVEASEDAPGWVRLRVRDQGAGVPPEHRSRIFEPFFTTKAPGRGTGLGLAIVAEVVRGAGGRIEVSGGPGQGAIFDLFFPAVERRAAARDAAPAPPEAPGGQGTVLLAEDDAPLRALLARELRRKGYRALEARDGAEALVRFEEARGAVDLLVADLAMPALGGRDLSKRLRGRAPGLPVLFITGHRGETEKGPDAEADSPILWKPFPPDALLSQVENLLGASRRASVRKPPAAATA